MSVGFRPSHSTEHGLEQLREAWRDLNSLLKNIERAQNSLKVLDLHQTGEHLNVAKWAVGEVKKRIDNAAQSFKTK